MRAKSARSSDDDRALVDVQNWSSYSHRELYDAVHQDNDPGRVGELAGEWSRLGAEMGEAAQRMAERLRGTEHGWQGEAATAARGAIHEIAGWTSEAGSTAGDLGKHVEEQGRAMEEAKSSMPEPVDVEFNHEIADRWAAGGTGMNALQGMVMAYSDLSEQAEEVDSKHDEAVQVMRKMEHHSRALDADLAFGAGWPDARG